MITVEQLSDDGLSRKAWVFRTYGAEMILDSYYEQTRQTKRHAWKGNRWASIDERQYYSGLERPTHIPPEVLQDAKKQFLESITVYIGWRNPDHLYNEGKS